MARIAALRAHCGCVLLLLRGSDEGAAEGEAACVAWLTRGMLTTFVSQQERRLLAERARGSTAATVSLQEADGATRLAAPPRDAWDNVVGVVGVVAAVAVVAVIAVVVAKRIKTI